MQEFLDITAACYDHSANGKIYRFSPLTLKDRASFLRWISLYEYKVLRDYLGNSPDEFGKEQLNTVWQTCWKKTTPTTDDITNALANFDGVIELLYLSLVHKHPNIEREEIASLIDDETKTKLPEAIMRISGFLVEEGQQQKKTVKKTKV